MRTVSMQDLNLDDPAQRSLSRVRTYREPFVDERVENVTVTGLANDDVRSGAPP